MNEAAFEAFYNMHSRPLWAYVCRLTNSPASADDIAQESFLRFLTLSHQPENAKAYLYRIATNLVYDNFRRSSREPNEDPSTVSEPVYEHFAAGDEISESFDKLKVQERGLLWLAYIEGRDHVEIAEILGLKVKSIKVLLFRARHKLAGILREESV